MTNQSARALAADVSAGRLDPTAPTTEAIARIERDNGGLGAIVRFDPGLARAEAATQAARLARGEHLPLVGVPVVVKDNIWVAGRTISQGSRLYSDFVAPEDAIAVARLRAAGAVIVGIGNCPEFACKGNTNSPLNGLARNPLNPALTAGGSSGGNAAAVAAGMVSVALGTDGGGSGRRPPAHCGIVGFKPSFGAIPYGPGFPEPFWGVAVHAPMGRTVDDVALLFEALVGPDTDDPDSIVIAAPDDAPPATLRIAFSPRFGLDVPVDADVSAGIEAAVAALRRAGWAIEQADPPWPAGMREDAVMAIQHAGLAALQGEAFRTSPELFDPDIAAQIERGFTLTGADVTRALETSLVARRTVGRFFKGFDLLIGPTVPCVAWPIEKPGPETIGGVPVPPRGHAVFTPLFNHALVPALSLPAGRGREGLPFALQIVAARGRDRRVLAAAAAIEHVLAESGLW